MPQETEILFLKGSCVVSLAQRPSEKKPQFEKCLEERDSFANLKTSARGMGTGETLPKDGGSGGCHFYTLHPP